MVANNEYFYSSERQAVSKKGVFELEGVDTILAQNKLMHQQLQQQIEMMTKRIDGLQLAAVSTTNQPPVVWGQQEESYEEQQPEQVQYMHNQGSGPYDFHGDTYNSSWRNHPNLKWGENQKNLERQLGQLSKQTAVERPTNALPSDTIPNPKEECKAIELRSEKTLENNKEANKKPVEDDKANSQEEVKVKEKDQEELRKKGEESQASKKGKQIMIEPLQEQRKEVKHYIPPLPYPQRLQRELKDQQFPKFLEVFKKLKINIALAEALEQMPLYAKFLKELINKKRSWNEKETMVLTQECSAVI
ncbi:uncharacterized protein LOC107646963 [Arachis ipaensis]|uniref:uncharacterized protein LOC107646963 n=1 Tax=Arachis ipaensis TaxID=130454 RepID=UPI0007AF142F|nr:uncharacterized protein LOC107646963 [Arachis ipaensis]XP_025661599.1 uncharacterized protein LOC112757206 [Arachis hypogaea]